jgi:DNA-binding NarL/FixJ family response regulator
MVDTSLSYVSLPLGKREGDFL